MASLLFAFQPSLLLAQVQMSDPDRVVQTKPKAPPPAKKASRKTATDNVSDDLNRREAERAESVVRSLSAPAALSTPVEAKPAAIAPAVAPVDALPPTVAAIPPRAPIAKAALTPGVDLGQPDLVSPPPATAPPTIVEQP
ncbi:MAG TPA: hypothetical protein VF915_00520, partial [Reyranella sp.]